MLQISRSSTLSYYNMAIARGSKWTMPGTSQCCCVLLRMFTSAKVYFGTAIAITSVLDADVVHCTAGLKYGWVTLMMLLDIFLNSTRAAQRAFIIACKCLAFPSWSC